MTIWHVVLGFLGLAVFGWIGWTGFQSLLQARLLRSWRRPSHAVLANSAAAVWGEVRVHDALSVHGFGDCLWHREVITVRRGKSSWTESDVSVKADFSVVADGHEFHVVDLPTEVQGESSMSDAEAYGIDHLLGAGRRTCRTYWLPQIPHLSVVGFVRRRDRRWEIEKDAAAGLLWSCHHPARAAFQEAVKGWLGLALAVAGFVTMAVLFFRLSP
jgi:hypothetical protein